MSAELLIQKVSKEFPGVLALNEVNLTLTGGTVHALLGENGAGKSTLIKIITGVYVADSGSMKVNGQEKSFNNPIESTEAGIAVVHQERNLIPEFSVEENITLHNPPLKFGIIDRAERTRLAKQALQTLGFEIDLNERVKNLSVAQMQLVEIAKALVTNAKIILLDEPTAGMARADTNNTIDLLKQIRDTRDITIAIIEHDMHVVFSLAERITVLAQGTPLVEETPENIKGHPKVREAYLGEAQV